MTGLIISKGGRSGDFMALDKVYKMYPTFEGWVREHRHSSSSVSSGLENAIEMGTDNPVEVLQSYITALTELRDEIRGEIDVARYWIRYFKSHKGDLRE
jgi:hypothetical protein